MAKKSIVLAGLAIIMAFMAVSCGNSPTTPDNSVHVNMILQYGDNNGLLLEQYLAYATDSAGATLTSAVISMIGPNGMLGVPGTNGTTMFGTNGAAPNYTPGAQYAVSVTNNAVNYYGTFTNNPDITIAADGSQVSWPFAADAAIIVIYPPSIMGMQMYGPALTSPFNVNATGIYGNGPGTYQIAPTITDTAAITFGQTGVHGTAVMQVIKMLQITKP